MSRAPQHVPSSWEVQRAIEQAHAVMEMLPVDDTKLLKDTLEGETDAFAVLDALVEAVNHAEVLAAGAREQARRLTERATRFERRETGYRALILTMLQTLKQTSLERPGYTVSVQQNEPELIIDTNQLPPTYWRQPPAQPDRTLARKHLKEGIDVPGATFGNSAQSIRVKV